MKPRNFEYIADKIIKVIEEKCTFDKIQVNKIIEHIEEKKSQIIIKHLNCNMKVGKN